MSLTQKDERRKAAELASWATPAQTLPELRKRLLGEQVRQARRSAGLTQLELARTLQIALSKLSRYESGLDPISPSRLLLTRFILGLAVGRRGLEGGVRSPRPNVASHLGWIFTPRHGATDYEAIGDFRPVSGAGVARSAPLPAGRPVGPARDRR
jgi:transcriptional regulator with XRE-family HTH domain